MGATILGENMGEKVASGSLRGGGYKALCGHRGLSGCFCLVCRKASFVLILLLYFTVFSCLLLLLGVFGEGGGGGDFALFFPFMWSLF